MSSAPSARALRGAATVAKILDAATAILSAEGAAAVSIQHVANAAGTSKGLVHYHFADKDALLVACVHHITSQLVEAESAALVPSTPASALDDLWATLSTRGYCELRRALLALATAATPGMRLSLNDSSEKRLRAAGRTVDTLTTLLHFDVPFSRPALSLAFVALFDGLALDAAGAMATRHKHAYDAFWLAVLSLTA